MDSLYAPITSEESRKKAHVLAIAELPVATCRHRYEAKAFEDELFVLFELIRLYGNTLASYPYATVNTANYYYLFDGNWDAMGNPARIPALAGLTVLSAGCGAFCCIKVQTQRNHDFGYRYAHAGRG